MRQTNWIDFAKGVAIFLVVLGHAIRGIKGSGLPIHSFWLELDALIYAFHMPLFFALSGWFYVRSIAKRTFVSFAANRLERVVYPMILWTYIFFGCKFLAGSHANSPITAGDFPLIPLPGILHFWFLWDLLVLSFMAYPLRFALRNDGIAPAVLVLAVVIALGLQFIQMPSTASYWIGSALKNAPFFLLGVVLGQARDFGRLGARGLVALAVVFVVVLAMWSNLANSELRPVGSLVLVVCVLGLIRDLDARCPAGLRSVLCVLGTASMTIYVAHTIFSAAFREALIFAAVVDPSVLILVGTIVGILGPLALLAVSRNLGISRILGLEVSAAPLSNRYIASRTK